MFITPAFAQGTAQSESSGTDMMMQILPFALIFIIFYFLLLRPQQAKAKQQKAILDALKKGDEIVTESGHIGTVFQIVDDNEVIIEFAPNVRIRTLRSKIAALTTPPAADLPKTKTKAS